jgi:tetratricopeptide (TPR) repeat protein
MHTKNVALGYMDNGDYVQALSAWREIVQILPEDPLGSRNLVIALLAPNDQGQGGFQGTNEEMAALLEATERMLRLEPEAATARMLAGRVYREIADRRRGQPDEMRRLVALARTQFQEAARLQPLDAAPHYDLYLLEADFVDPDRLTEQGLAALQAAARRTPNNLRVQLELALRQSEAEQADVRGTLEKVLNLLPEGEADARKEIQQALKLVPPGTPQIPAQVAQHLYAARNLLQQRVFFLEGLREVQPHPLTFLLDSFSAHFYEGLPADVETAIQVALHVLPPQQLANDGRRRHVLTCRLARLWGDDRQAYVILSRIADGGLLEVRDPNGQELVAPLQFTHDWYGFHLCDLDLDIQPRPEGNAPADLDLVLYGSKGFALFELIPEDHGYCWKEQPVPADLLPLNGIRSLSAWDLDHDGNLDLVLCSDGGTRILRNHGDWRFTDISALTPRLAELPSTACAVGDCDNDGDLDMYFVSAGELVFAANVRGGRFALSRTDIEAWHCTVVDINNDGVLDVLTAQTDSLALYLGAAGTLPHKGQSVAVTDVHSSRQPIVALGTIDYDNDGFQDLWFVTAGEPSRLEIVRNVGGGFFRHSGLTMALPRLEQDRLWGNVQTTDADNDGDLDVVMTSPEGPILIRNDGGNQNRWLKVRLRAMLNRDALAVGRAARVNYYGRGSTLELRSGRHYAMQVAQDTETHFGLGQRRQVDTVRVVWTNGVPQVVIRPQPDAVITEEQRPKGSCPFLYVWNGSRYEFITDCLWTSALGMRLADDVVMDHSRQQCHLLVPGEKLKVRDGSYVLQFTNELWEVPYLDKAELWVIRHPATTAMYTNRRIPQGKEDISFFPARRRYQVCAARDDRGRDVLGALQLRDDLCVGGFERERYVGLAQWHWIELDMGDLSHARSAVLFLTGWVWPTDTSANVAISRDRRFSGTRGMVGGIAPPSLQVPDGTGGWRTVVEVVGFPCGKMQTLAIPLPLEKFPPGDYRVRIGTRMEVYWDEAFYTVDEEPLTVDDLEIMRLRPIHGHLHYRGFSSPYQVSSTGPHRFDYDDVIREAIWRTPPGPYTRYGPVTELLGDADDRYVVMAPGDELTLAFPALEVGKDEGITFLFVCQGWLKDFDLNGVGNESVLPLPYAAMRRYPYGVQEQHPDTTFIRQYLTRP